ncbi:hypothetical protein LBMAG52_06280 [Planctomycetia bacterium]|nr:hypothetical protein LBMAG52_06280 [Planctomycetia bacterium]
MGATWDGAGVNFALFSQHAKKFELCLFDSPDAKQESHRIEFPEQADQVWHGDLPDVQPGQLYGDRVPSRLLSCVLCELSAPRRGSTEMAMPALSLLAS